MLIDGTNATIGCFTIEVTRHYMVQTSYADMIRVIANALTIEHLSEWIINVEDAYWDIIDDKGSVYYAIELNGICQTLEDIKTERLAK